MNYILEGVIIPRKFESICFQAIFGLWPITEPQSNIPYYSFIRQYYSLAIYSITVINYIFDLDYIENLEVNLGNSIEVYNSKAAL
jgi:hypothetical protein